MISNLRDLGGMQAADKRTIRKRLLIRSANLSEAEPEDLQGISAVIDLRTTAEREEKPDRVYGAAYLTLPVFEELTAGISHEKEADKQRMPDMADLYRQLIRECAESFRKILMAVMEHDFSSGAILWHCSEGKDRGGIVTALILEALGVSREDILKDYLLTNRINLPKAALIRDQLARTQGQEYAEEVYRVYIADESYLKAAWETMGENYIRSGLGIEDRAVWRFRETVLE